MTRRYKFKSFFINQEIEKTFKIFLFDLNFWIMEQSAEFYWKIIQTTVASDWQEPSLWRMGFDYIHTGWGLMIDQNFDPIFDTIYAVDTISQLPKAS